MPEVSERVITSITDDDVFVRYMLRKLPLTGFEFRGFGVVTIADVTQQQSMVHIKEQLWKLKDDVSCMETAYEDLRLSVKSLLGSDKIEIGAMPFIIMNGRMVRKAGEGLVGGSVLTEQEVQTFSKHLKREPNRWWWMISQKRDRGSLWWKKFSKVLLIVPTLQCLSSTSRKYMAWWSCLLQNRV
ncbi:hypothetical protein KRR40_28435 [Niabella defluvii]|nr:hypothetical protein KRR40_28435 [Niabella sp. I65]